MILATIAYSWPCSINYKFWRDPNNLSRILEKQGTIALFIKKLEFK